MFFDKIEDIYKTVHDLMS